MELGTTIVVASVAGLANNAGSYIFNNVADELGVGEKIKEITRKAKHTVNQEWNDGWERDYEAGGISSVVKNAEAEMA
ncbi:MULTISPECIES: hypothetical protein [Planktothricoides]|uniref:Uncharacterized protein n=1 Tax=Planktothricoides raciborskii FACHB-1370 TaxID=2949576 RepID=A0ABR8ELL8_9CYAN|nr:MULTISPECIES: hypothetical protein [Planktothricoides]KOR36457.1 hypothetical protein AM228_12920 [Planktothricoides sp. SR001]MBD2546467.1 hypothetical protein [Planktothricoides raciborskii FACHB-1370]MBD2582286.1 hypothetical protein [Planktothricoides raciborskii FACHB-1261]